MNIKPILMTVEGLQKLKNKQKKLLEERPVAVADLKKAREMGDLSENGYYKSSRFKLSSIDARLRHLTHLIRFAKVQEKKSTSSVGIGVTVKLKSDGEEFVYTIVGEHEANPSKKKISHLSPLGKALMYRKTGEEIHTITPKGKKVFTVKKIS